MSRWTYVVQRIAVVGMGLGIEAGVILTNWGQLPRIVLETIFVVMALAVGLMWAAITDMQEIDADMQEGEQRKQEAEQAQREADERLSAAKRQRFGHD